MKFEEETRKIIGCAMRVHSELGPGFPELIYQRALEIEFRLNNIPFVRECELEVYYLDHVVGSLRPDFYCFDAIPVEIKATSELDKGAFAQAINYVEAFHAHVGLLLNFGKESLEFKRLHNNIL